MADFPCLICEKPLAFNHNAVCCDKCNYCVCRYCNNSCKQTWKTKDRVTQSQPQHKFQNNRCHRE